MFMMNLKAMITRVIPLDFCLWSYLKILCALIVRCATKKILFVTMTRPPRNYDATDFSAMTLKAQSQLE